MDRFGPIKVWLRSRLLYLLILCLALPLAGCSERADAPAEPPTRYEGTEAPQIANLLSKGILSIEPIRAVAEKLDTASPFGEIVTLNIKNLSSQPQTFRIDCGTVLRTTSARFQDLVVTRSQEATIVAYGNWSGKLEVFSLQLRRHYPYQPAEYHLGNLAGGDLRRFIECFCYRHPEGEKLDLTPVQYAIWSIVDNVNLTQVLAYARRGNPSAEEMTAIEQNVREQGQFTEQLLKDCQITAKFLD